MPIYTTVCRPTVLTTAGERGPHLCYNTLLISGWLCKPTSGLGRATRPRGGQTLRRPGVTGSHSIASLFQHIIPLFPSSSSSSSSCHPSVTHSFPPARDMGEGTPFARLKPG